MNATLACGQTVQGRYCVVRLLGQGGFGAVYLVQDTRLGGKSLALKESFDSSPEAQRQFQLEANLLAGLSHPNLPRVTDYFIEPNGRQYLVMDYIEGQDLAELIIARGTPLPESQAVNWMIQVCQAVAYLHGQRPRPIIHRDIKPHNIKITPDGRAVLVDFGIAKLYEPHKGTARIAKAFSPGFSPPEQYAGTTDTRSDVYALGATLYAMVTATVPPDAFTERLVQRAPLTPPTQLNAQVSAALERVILQALELDPNRRFPSAQELLQALQGALMGRSIVAPAAPVGPICPRCGNVNRPGARFCSRDGTPLSPQPVMPAPASSAPSAMSPQLSFEMGNAYARNNQYDQAIQAYRQALAGGLTDQALYHNLGLVYIMASRPAEAIPVLQQGISRYPKDGDLHYQLGRAYALTGKLSESVQELEQAKALQPHDAAVRTMLGLVLQDLKQHKQAITELEQAVRLKKDEPIVHFLLGKSYLFTDQFDKAERVFGEAVRLDPNDADYHYYLGVTRLRKKQPDGAIQALQQAIKLASDHYLAHYFLGEAYLAKDNYQEALRWFQKAAPMDPTDPDPHTRMAICYALLNRRTDAIAAVRQALAIDPNNKQARELLSKL
jgi:serine/threonine protein kinase/cytochrome c-type biogenesis protein CcmH/NrfG